jgi:hypothetical protein
MHDLFSFDRAGTTLDASTLGSHPARYSPDRDMPPMFEMITSVDKAIGHLRSTTQLYGLLGSNDPEIDRALRVAMKETVQSVHNAIALVRDTLVKIEHDQ